MAKVKKLTSFGVGQLNTNSPGVDDLTWSSLGRVAVFVDSANVIYSLRDLGWKMDFKKLKKFFENQVKLREIYFYSAYFEDDLRRKNLLEMLSRKGYIVRSKPVKYIKDAKNKTFHKANCDVELTMDVMLSYQGFDAAVIFSGDSDFLPLLEFLKGEGKKVVSISTRGHVAKEIVQAADLFIHFDRYKKLWMLEGSGESKNPDRSRGSR